MKENVEKFYAEFQELLAYEEQNYQFNEEVELTHKLLRDNNLTIEEIEELKSDPECWGYECDILDTCIEELTAETALPKGILELINEELKNADIGLDSHQMSVVQLAIDKYEAQESKI